MSSRNIIPAHQPGLTVVVGWDNPLGTFFAQVDRQQDNDDPRDPTLLWVGCAPGEILRGDELIAPLAPLCGADGGTPREAARRSGGRR